VLPRFFAPHLTEDDRSAEVVLSPEESRHATRVLRLSSGDELAVFDGRGHEWRARILSVSKAGVVIRREEIVEAAREPRIFVTLLQAVLKGDHMDVVIRDMTMVGISAIRPVMTAHTVVSASAASGAKAHERWLRVAVASAKQSRRAVVPAIAPAQSLAEAVERVTDATASARIVLAEPLVRRSGRLSTPDAPASAVLAVGPEGGWSREELELFERAGFEPLTLGALTLRADAAAMVAISVLRERWKDL
jgi:16S rRNA (uracil1498-N3)-methyltransferase